MKVWSGPIDLHSGSKPLHFFNRPVEATSKIIGVPECSRFEPIESQCPVDTTRRAVVRRRSITYWSSE